MPGIALSIARAQPCSADDLELYLRSILLKLAVCDAALTPNPAGSTRLNPIDVDVAGCTFAIMAHTRLSEADAASRQQVLPRLFLRPTAQAFPWVPAGGSIEPQPSHLVPLKAVDLRAVRIQVHAARWFCPSPALPLLLLSPALHSWRGVLHQ